ncbi:hypothetical protein COO60DRAFT_890091 [Scenedesmus sp. NREL 46B-D3]|nr:hypothetical protein COO60DRAFT_890091 [Scenedesmus sp. NREL 46B-D3]
MVFLWTLQGTSDVAHCRQPGVGHVVCRAAAGNLRRYFVLYVCKSCCMPLLCACAVSWEGSYAAGADSGSIYVVPQTSPMIGHVCTRLPVVCVYRAKYAASRLQMDDTAMCRYMHGKVAAAVYVICPAAALHMCQDRCWTSSASRQLQGCRVPGELFGHTSWRKWVRCSDGCVLMALCTIIRSAHIAVVKHVPGQRICRVSSSGSY